MNRIWKPLSVSLTVSLACLPWLLASAARAQPKVYAPIPLTAGQEIRDRLSEFDIPTGQGNFARDYVLSLQAGDQVVIDLAADSFDPIVVLMTKEGATIGENDDGPDGTANSLLFMRITKSGTYIVRVKAFGETAGGTFRLKLDRLRPVQ